MEKDFDICEYFQEISQINPSDLSNEQLIEIVGQINAVLYCLNQEQQDNFSVFSAKKAYEYQNVRFAKELEKRNIKVVTMEEIEVLIQDNPEVVYQELKKYDLVSLLELADAWEKNGGTSDIYKLILGAIRNEIASRSAAPGVLN